MTEGLHLTVIVCTHDRPALLERCLRALAELTEPVDVLVVDSASATSPAELVARFGSSFRIVREPEGGLARARNVGLRETRGELVAFVDDDAEVAADWATRIRSAFSDPAVGCVGGACVPRFEVPRPDWLSDLMLQFAGITGFGDEPREARSSAEYPFGANMAFRRRALEQVGGFPETLGRKGRSLLSGEDGAAVGSLRRAGWSVRLEPCAVVRHWVAAERCTRSYYWRRIWWEGRTHARMGNRWRRPAGLAVEAPTYLWKWLRSGDRFYLYRATAETLGHFAEWTAPLRGSA